MRVTIPLPEKTWASTTQLRWVQEVRGQGSKVTPWSLDDVYVGEACPDHCSGHGDCVDGVCTCDAGYEGGCLRWFSVVVLVVTGLEVGFQWVFVFSGSLMGLWVRSGPLVGLRLVDGFEGGVGANWQVVSGGGVGLGCNSLAPYGHGKHLYFSGCGTRQAVTAEMDTRRASHDHSPSCRVDLSDPQRSLDKGVVLQYTSDNGITWTTLNVHDPLDFRKVGFAPARVAYSLPPDARSYGVQLRWWQPDHDGASTDQWAVDNVEIVLAQRKDTSKYNSKGFHDSL
nr:reelin-like [Penaeus vannamei]